jgi:hypothetical protein
LDLARYADTHGYHIDSHREMWPWRNWLIDAFNRNQPYDQFTVEQLAGDLLPNTTLEQKIATGFDRNHMINFEGGAIPEEYQNEYVVDRVETTAATWLGLTMGCARCHDHKYDPISQKDFYRFYAFFNTIPEKGLDGRKGNAEPFVQIPSGEQARELEDVNRKLTALRGKMPEADEAKMEAAWEADRLATMPLPTKRNLVAHYTLDGGLGDSSGNYRDGRTVAGDVNYGVQQVGRGAEFDGETHVVFGGVADFERTEPFSVAFWMRASSNKGMAVIEKVGDGAAPRGWEVAVDDSVFLGQMRRGAPLILRFTHHWPEDAIEIRTRRPLPMQAKEERGPRPWYHIAIVSDGSGTAAGIKLYVNGEVEPVEVVRDHLTGSIRTLAPLEVGNRELAPPFHGQLDDLRIYSGALTEAEIRQLAVEEPVRAALSFAEGKRTKEQKALVHDYYLSYDAPPEWRENYAQLKKLEAEHDDLDDAIPASMVMSEMEKPRETAVLGRGDYRNRGEIVTPGVPPVLPPLPKEAPLNRLTLARWLVDPSHPLTARVAVNRFWQMYFSTGIVKTPQDFGSQGDPPSHPELLDWLATEFIRGGWDVKAMQKLIVMSATYRQSSKVTPDLEERDPENRLLARGPRFRLPAELIRDNALYASGLLNEQVGGPSVFPYQPNGLWEEIAFGDVYSAQSYTPSRGRDLYRKSMYTFWKRTSPPPEMVTFDAPTREKCTARRSLTNTPLQALVLMNDPTYVEAARALAQRMMAEGGSDARRRIAYGFRLATGRRPDSGEVKVLLDLARTEGAEYRGDAEAARKLLTVGETAADARTSQTELAAWTTVASVILNLDETITKE